MTSKQRVLATLNHELPDRVPVDLGGWQSGICYGAYDNLKRSLGIDRETRLLERVQGLAVIDDEILDAFHVDTRYIFPVYLSGEDSIPRENHAFRDPWGITWYRPRGSFYYDIKHPSLHNASSPKDINSHPWPSPEMLCDEAAVHESMQSVDHHRFAVFTSLSSVFEQATYLRSMERFYMDLVTDIPLTESLLDRVLEVELATYKKFFGLVGDRIDVVEFWNDFGSQSGPLISPDFFRSYVKPRERKLIDCTLKHTGARIALHSCGSVFDFIPDFIDMGVEILNPVQTTARNMDPRTLKREFGKHLVFWGSIDTQRILPFGNPEDVRREVQEKIAVLGEDGGYLLAPCHNIQNNTPPENVLALFSAAENFGRYSRR
jgi:uroporphyrinogen decarboxylase